MSHPPGVKKLPLVSFYSLILMPMFCNLQYSILLYSVLACCVRHCRQDYAGRLILLYASTYMVYLILFTAYCVTIRCG